MCVIFIADSRKPSLKELRLAEDSNPDGAGIAWVEEGRVVFHKGLSADEIGELIENEKPAFPFVVHFRLATIGGSSKGLTHPFPVTGNVNLKTHGILNSPVLFHNGHYGYWEETLIPIRATHPVPKGGWSDSRGLAWLAYHAGIQSMDLIDGQRITVLEPDGTITKFGNGWSNNNGLLASNRTWENPWEQYYRTTGFVSQFDDAEFEYTRDVKTKAKATGKKVGAIKQTATGTHPNFKSEKPWRRITTKQHEQLINGEDINGLPFEERSEALALENR